MNTSLINLVSRIAEVDADTVQKVLVSYHETLLIDLSLRGYVDTPMGRMTLQDGKVVLESNSALAKDFLQSDMTTQQMTDKVIDIIVNT